MKGPSDFERGKRYIVQITHTFEGVYRGEGMQAGQPALVFETDPAAGNPRPGSGERKVLPINVTKAVEV